MYRYKYKNEIFQHQCIPYAIIGYETLRHYSCISNISIKRYKINFDDDEYDPYHYYIEFKFNNKISIILDNTWYYSKRMYKNDFKPKKIEKLKASEIKQLYREYSNDLLSNFIYKDVMTHLNNDFPACY
jgi:hypothetical protein